MLNVAKVSFLLKVRQIEKEFSLNVFENFEAFVSVAGQEALDYALEWAAYYGRLDLVCKAVDRGAGLSTSNGGAFQMACRNGHLHVVRYFVETGMVNNLNGVSILMDTVEMRQADVVTYLLENKIFDIHCAHDCALRAAVEASDANMVQLLINLGADVNALGGHPLIIAAKNGNVAIAKLLLESGADRSVLPMAIETARSSGHSEMVSVLLVH